MKPELPRISMTMPLPFGRGTRARPVGSTGAMRPGLRQVVLSGALASLCSAAALALCGQIERGTWAGPNNGRSQWIWGRHAAYRRRASLRYTLVGYGIHHTMATGWAWLHEAVFGASKRKQSPAERLVRAAVTSGTAAFVDFQLTPRRLQPGFDAQ